MRPVTFRATVTSYFLLSVQLSTILRSKRFRGVGEQRKTEERDFLCFTRAKNGVIAKHRNERVGEGKEGKAPRQTPRIWKPPTWPFMTQCAEWDLMLSSVVRTLRTKYVRNIELAERRNLDESERLMQALKLKFQKLNLIISKKIFSIRLKGRTQFKGEVLVLCPKW